MNSDVELICSTFREDAAPEAGVAVSTYDRPRLLTRLLEGLSAQAIDPARFEVVIVDNGSSDETADVLRRFGAETELQLRALKLAVNRGPAVARNVAWRHGRADVVAFTDDDCVPTPEWLTRGLELMCDGDSVVVGRTLPDPSLPVGPFSRTIRVEDVNWLPTCNVFYRRSDLEAVDGFDESFPTPAGEDTDLAYRVRDSFGRKFRFSPEALVYHDVRPSRFLDAAREATRWAGIPRFFKLHPEARERIHRRISWKTTHPKTILAMSGLALALHHPGWLVLTLPWMDHRTRIRRPPGRRRQAYAAIPGTFVIDALEVLTMVRGSVAARTVIL